MSAKTPYDGTARPRFVGQDADGVEWLGGWTMPQKMTFGTWLIEGRLSSLIVNEQPRLADDIDEEDVRNFKLQVPW